MAPAGYVFTQYRAHRRAGHVAGYVTNTPITRLHACSQHLTDAGLKTLAALTDLEELDLRGSRITDVALKSLAVLTKLKTLDLRGTGITNAGVQSRRQALPGCRIVLEAD